MRPIQFNNFNELCPNDKRQILSFLPGIKSDFLLKHPYKINTDILKYNLQDECDREVEVSYWPMLPLINESTPIADADYIIYGHFYARFHNFQEEVKRQIEETVQFRKPGAKIIVVGKACNVKPFLDPNIEDIIFFESHYAEELGKFFNLPIKEQYFVYDEQSGWLNMWPVDGCNRLCKFCRRTYMHIPFESLSLDFIKENLDWYKENCPEKMEYIMLRAENLTEYGLDIYGYQALPELIKLLNSYPEIKHISIMIGLAISEINDDILNAICDCHKFLEIYLNIEAGSDRLLEVIGKGHTRQRAIEVFKRLRASNPNIRLHTNVMIGLPTETIVDIVELADLVNTIEPNSIYALRYRMDPGQPLAQYPYMSDQLWAYHLKLFLRLLRQGKRSIPLNIKTIKVPNKSRKYIREAEIIAREQEFSYEDLDQWQSISLPGDNLKRIRTK